MLDNSRVSFDWLERRNELSPDREALVDIFTGRRFTYRQFNERTNRLANGWRQNWGIQKGDRIAILAKNCPEYLEAFFAVAKLGAILVPINIRLVGSELTYIFDDCRPKGLVLGQDFLQVISQVRAEINVKNSLLLDGARSEGMDSYEDFLDAADPRTPPLKEENDLNDPHVILYTSGTTGYPKGAIQTHGNILFNSLNANLALDLVSTDITLCGLPLFHTGGLHVMTTPTLHAGGTVVIQRAFDAGEALQIIHERMVNTVFFVSTMWLFMSQHKDFAKTDFSGLRLAWTGGAPCPIPVIEAYQKKGVAFRQGYGLTEVGPDATILAAEDAIRKAGSAGKPPFHSALRIVDEEGRGVAAGETGELIFRGPTVTPGYWNKPEATAEALKEGWFHTGDLAYMDEDGYVFIVDRKKDMIISGGENVYPAEVEKVIYQHSKVAEAAVFGVPNEKWGEVGHAVVCPKPGETLSEHELMGFLDGKLARFKIPKSISFMETLPRNPTGKVLKRVMREPYWKGHDEKQGVPPKVSPAVTQNHPDAATVFKDSYVVEFLDLPQEHSERDLHGGLVSKLKDFLIELGRDFCFVGSEYPVQVGMRDFSLDLLFFHRGLNCLCAIELKVGRFEPEHLGKLEFYLEALDRDLRKPHEGPSIGILLCANKDSEVVEYALSRSVSPALVAEYQTRLPDKKLLQAKLHEFYALTETGALEGPGDNIPRPRVPESRHTMTPAVEAQLNERQRAMAIILLRGEPLTSRRCEEEFHITRDTANRDFMLLMKLGLAVREGKGRSTRYVLPVKT